MRELRLAADYDLSTDARFVSAAGVVQLSPRIASTDGLSLTLNLESLRRSDQRRSRCGRDHIRSVSHSTPVAGDS